MNAPWWFTEKYSDTSALPVDLVQLSGPNGVALARLWPNGKTSKGWGLQGANGAPGFIDRYERGMFNPNRILAGYRRNSWAFCFIMRSLNVVAIDIDGKNGGIEHAEELLQGSPPTLAETSKSGTGFHLFYATEETWNPVTGFGHDLGDHIGIAPGVDIRAVGCVYHYNTQNWNRRSIALAPSHILDALREKTSLRVRQAQYIQTTLNSDPLEVLLMQDTLLAELEQPIPPGRRNNTLFAIGMKLAAAAVPDWQTRLEARAGQVGLDTVETTRLIANIQRQNLAVNRSNP